MEAVTHQKRSPEDPWTQIAHAIASSSQQQQVHAASAILQRTNIHHDPEAFNATLDLAITQGAEGIAIALVGAAIKQTFFSLNHDTAKKLFEFSEGRYSLQAERRIELALTWSLAFPSQHAVTRAELCNAILLKGATEHKRFVNSDAEFEGYQEPSSLSVIKSLAALHLHRMGVAPSSKVRELYTEGKLERITEVCIWLAYNSSGRRGWFNTLNLNLFDLPIDSLSGPVRNLVALLNQIRHCPFVSFAPPQGISAEVANTARWTNLEFPRDYHGFPRVKGVHAGVSKITSGLSTREYSNELFNCLVSTDPDLADGAKRIFLETPELVWSARKRFGAAINRANQIQSLIDLPTSLLKAVIWNGGAILDKSSQRRRTASEIPPEGRNIPSEWDRIFDIAIASPAIHKFLSRELLYLFTSLRNRYQLPLFLAQNRRIGDTSYVEAFKSLSTSRKLVFLGAISQTHAPISHQAALAFSLAGIADHNPLVRKLAYQVAYPILGEAITPEHKSAAEQIIKLTSKPWYRAWASSIWHALRYDTFSLPIVLGALSGLSFIDLKVKHDLASKRARNMLNRVALANRLGSEAREGSSPTI